MAKGLKSGKKHIPTVKRSAAKGKFINADNVETGPTSVGESYSNYVSVIAAPLDEYKNIKNHLTYWLGLSNAAAKNLTTYFDFINLSNTGITKASINTLADHIGITRKFISENIFDISVKTMERKENREKLNKKISSHALEIAKLLQHAYSVFRDEEKVKRWLNRENRALNNMKPVELLDTLSGLVLVDDVLGRIEEGVYS
jgi:putative toxin-antitoxin system antitoxin component (TIGR02293 family)